VRVRYWSAPARMRYNEGFSKGLPVVMEIFEVVSTGVEMG
jgi:hypothetical protein